MTYDMYAAFGNKVRVKLLLCLAHKPKSVTELVETCKLSQSAVSQHLAKLKEAHLVQTKKDGKLIYYSLRYSTAAMISKHLLILESEVV